MFIYYFFHRWQFLFQFSFFDLVILLICRRCRTFSRLLMPTIGGDGRYLKASCDNHTYFLSCFSYSRYSTCLVCKPWPGSTWELADKRRLYCTRRTTMTKTISSSKKKNNVISELSEDIASKDNGITTPHYFTAVLRPIRVAVLRMGETFIA